jgi:hypothetical protein
VRLGSSPNPLNRILLFSPSLILLRYFHCFTISTRPLTPFPPRRPGSSAGKLVVHKTEKLRNLEAEARKKRLEDPAAAAAAAEEKRAPRSCLPPAKDRKKAAKPDVFHIAEDEEPVAPAQ